MDEREFSEFLAQARRLTPEQYKQFIQAYAGQTGQNDKRAWDQAVAVELEQHLIELEINCACPACGSVAVVHNGFSPAGVQRLQCKDCGANFTRFTGTMLERSRFPWAVWVESLRSLMNGDSLETTQTILDNDFACDGIDLDTVFLMRHKLMHAMTGITPPKLSGVIQMDETELRESQKGSLELVSYIKGETRVARYGRRPSKYGVLGPEFGTILTAVDSRGYCVCKLVSLGRAPTDAVIDMYENHCIDAAFLCSDANTIYTQTCDLFDIPHYVRPSDYTQVIKRAGYLGTDKVITWEKWHECNRAVLERLYKDGKIDYIQNREDLSFAEFSRLKKNYKLSLGKVNELHREIKLLLEKEKTNVATKHLPDYLAYFQFRRNWKIDHDGRAPVNRKDAESILKLLLPLKITQTGPELAAVRLDIPKSSGRAVQLLKERTEKAREITKNKYIKLSAEGIPSFNKREILLDAPRARLNEIAKEYKIKGCTKMNRWVLAAEIAKKSDVDELIVRLILSNRSYGLDKEDIDYIESQQYLNMG